MLTKTNARRLVEIVAQIKDLSAKNGMIDQRHEDVAKILGTYKEDEYPSEEDPEWRKNNDEIGNLYNELLSIINTSLPL